MKSPLGASLTAFFGVFISAALSWGRVFDYGQCNRSCRLHFGSDWMTPPDIVGTRHWFAPSTCSWALQASAIWVRCRGCKSPCPRSRRNSTVAARSAQAT